MASSYATSLKAKYPEYAHWASVERFVADVRALDPLLILLFGSLAKGDFTSHSDADVLVVTRESVDWLDVYEHSDGLVQPLVKTLTEIETRLAAGAPFLCEIIEDGVPLYEVEGTHARLQARVEEAKALWDLERVPGGWRWRGQNDD